MQKWNKYFSLSCFLLLLLTKVTITNSQNYYPLKEDISIFMATNEDRIFANGVSTRLLNKKIVYNLNLYNKQILNQDTIFSLIPIHAIETCWTSYIRKGNGDHIIVLVNSDSIILKLNTMIGDSWIGYVTSGNTTTSVTYTSFQIETFLNGSDSVKTYTFANGKEIKISKKYGIIKAFNAFSNGNQYTLSIFSIPLLALGKDITDARTLNFYEPEYTYGYDNFVNDPAIDDSYTRAVIKSKTVSSNGDTISYDIASITKSYPVEFSKNIYTNYTLKITKDYNLEMRILNSKTTCDDSSQPYPNCSPFFDDKWYYALLFSGSDTIFELQNLIIFEDSDTYYSWSFQKGLVENSFFSADPTYLLSKDTQLVCIYPTNSQVPTGCEKFEAIDAISASAISANAIRIVNPITDFLKIDIDEEVQGESIISMINSNGELIFQTSYQGSGEYSKDVRALSKGIYCVKIINNQRSINKKVVIE